MEERERADIVVWSDYVCPFCYLELPVLERVEEAIGGRVEVSWRAFELRPEPVPTLDPDSGYLDDVWERAVRPMAEERGVDLRRPPVQPRSRRALETAVFARERGAFGPVHRGLFRAFFREGRDLSEPDVLADVVERAGLDADELAEALAEDRHTEEVLRDQVEARELGVDGVPALFVGPAGGPLEEAALLSGAQPYERVAGAVRRVLGEEPGTGEGAA